MNTLWIIATIVAVSNASDLDGQKEERSFSLFSVVNFSNGECNSSSLKGTCFTTEECASAGGTSGARCASGFGVCCIFEVSACGGTVTRNTTYITSPNFPTSFTTQGDCTYTINKAHSSVCQLRLDFETLVTTQGANGKCGGAMNIDAIKVTTPDKGTLTGINGICGTSLSGSHMYVDYANPGSVSITFNIGNVAGTRNWRIRVTQYEKGSLSKAPPSCLQYYTGASNKISSYNAAGGQLVASHSYTNCIRKEQGMCSIQYTADRDDSFMLTPPAANSQMAGAADCLTSYVIILGAISAGNINKFCGGKFSSAINAGNNGPIISKAEPFGLGVAGLMDTTGTKGFVLNYNQIPC